MSLVRIAPRHVAWETDRGRIASAKFDREGDVVTVTELEYNEVESARALFDAVAAAVTASRIVGSHDALRECGFEQSGAGWVREIATVPAASAFVTLAQLEAAIRDSWGADTSEEPDVWTAENPGWGNCVVTSLVVRDYLGGEIVSAGVLRDGVRIDRHAWNRLPSGLEIDLSRDQFAGDEDFEAPEAVERFMADDTEQRYEVLAKRVRARLGRT